MTLHPYTSLPELIAYCQLCHEHRNKCTTVKVDALTLRRVREIAHITEIATRFLGIKFVQK